MIFKGYVMTFSTVGEKQYETIGKIWDLMSNLYGISNIRGLGYGWTDSSITYCFGFKEELSDDVYLERLETVNELSQKPFRFNKIEIPDSDWKEFNGTVNTIPEVYDEVYKDGNLDFEIETFDEEGNFKTVVHYVYLDREKLNRAYTKMVRAEALAITMDIVAFLFLAGVVLMFSMVIRGAISASFLTIGVPIISALIVFFFHCGLLVNRVNKRKQMAQLILDMRLPEGTRKLEADNYRVSKFINDMLEAQKKIDESH